MSFRFKAALIGAVVAMPLAAQAENWDLANEYPATSIHAEIADFFAKAVKEGTKGEIEIVNHHGASLGYKSIDHFDAVGDGALQLASSSFVFWTGIDPIFQLPSLPFLAPTVEDTRKLYDLAKPEYAQALDEANQVLLFATPWPSSGLWGNKPFESADDMKGIKVRTYDTASTDTMRNAGAFPVQIAWADVPAQLSTNAIDSVLTSADGGVGAQFWEMQSNFTQVNYAMPLQAVHLNKDAWNALDDAQREEIRKAAADAEAFGWNLLATRTEENYAKMREHGMTVTESIDGAFADFLGASAQPFIDAWVEKAGPEARKLLDAYKAQR